MSISSPTEITSQALQVYYDPSDVSSMNIISNKLAGITDQTTNNIDAVQSVTDDQPEVGLVLKNGQYVIHFDGVSDHLISDSFSSPIAQPTTEFFYIERDNDTFSPHVIDGIDNTDRHLVYYNTTDWRLYAGSSTVGVGAHNAGPNFIIIEYNGSVSKMYVDGSLLSSVTVGNNKIGGLMLGCKYNQTSFFEGKLSQIGLFSGILTTQERTDLDNWGRRKMGLIVTLAPTNPSCGAGDEQNEITFDNVVGKTSYDIWWNTSSPAESGTKITGVTSGYFHTALSNGTTYYYKIFGVNDAGDGALSSEVNGTPSSGPPSEFLSRGSNKKRVAINTSIKVWQERMNNN